MGSNAGFTLKVQREEREEKGRALRLEAGGARYAAASGGGLWEPWGAAGDGGGSEGRASVPTPPQRAGPHLRG